MADYVHIPHILTGDNPLDINLGDSRFYDKTVLNPITNATDYEPAVFPATILDGLQDWEFVMFGVMWEHFEDPTSPDQTQASLNDTSYGQFCLLTEDNTGSPHAHFDQEFSSAQGVDGIFNDGSVTVTDPLRQTLVNVSSGIQNPDGAEVLVQMASVRGNDNSTYVDGADGWDGYRLSIANLGVSGIDSADYNTGPPGGSGNWSLAIPTTQSQGGTDLYWHQLYLYGPGKYIKYIVNNKLAFRRRNGTVDGVYPIQFNNTFSNKAIRFKFFMRTENYDTVYSNEGTITDIRQGVFLDSESAAWEYNRGEDLPADVTINAGTNTIDDIVYPNVALTQITYPISAKLGTPSDTTDAGYIYQGMKIFMPSNWDNSAGEFDTSIAHNRTFLGSRLYNTNSAWCTWDYITDTRYGMGNMFTDTKRTDGSYSGVTSNQQYKHLFDDLYDIGLRCDETVRNEAGTADVKRYDLNVVIDGDGTKMETLAQLCSNFDGKPFFHNGYLRIYQDRPKSISGVLNQTNATEFSYSGGSDRNRANQVFVKFNNPQKLFSQDAVYTEDRQALKPPAASVSKDVIGFGITNKGQAIRHGRTMLAKEKNQDEIITFNTGMNATHLKPGDLIVVSNSNNEEQRFGGRISSINTSTNVVTLDENFDFEPTTSYKIYIQNGSTTTPVLEKNITVHSGTSSNTCTIENTTDLVAHKTDSAGAAFVIVPVAEDTFTYEIQRISETDNEFMYEIGAMKYDEDKFGELDATFISGFDYDTNFPASYDEDV